MSRWLRPTAAPGQRFRTPARWISRPWRHRARARLRATACHATSQAAAAVDLAYEAGGASSIYTKSPLQRCFRDVHVATQHVMVNPTSATLAGRVLLGVESDVSTL